MKKTHIIGIILVALGAFFIFNSSSDVSTYANFDEATDGKRVKVVGELAKDREMIYDPLNAPDEFKFFLKDNDGEVKQVLLKQTKPQDFERSESIVVTGTMVKDVFVADEILMKCPSKYKDQEISLKSDLG